MNTNINGLKTAWLAAKEANPKMRIRDLAKEIGTSEAQLVALGADNIRLEGDFRELLKSIHRLGSVMALTRNDNAVHERHGVYNNTSFEGMVGLVLDADIDLRIFVMNWKFGFAVNEGDRRSLQFFDKSGEAVHKIYLTEHSNGNVFDELVAGYRAADPELLLQTESYPAPAAELPDADIDAAGFQQAWLALEDTHQFFGLLKKFNVTRTQSLRLAPEGHATEVEPSAVRAMLEAASEKGVPIMVFVANRGCIQIHSGPVSKLLATGPWFNVLDPEFNLHLREEAIASAYIVKKPSTDGIVTSLEVFDASGEMIVQFFGKRKPGIPELAEWREVVAGVSAAAVVHQA